jgi:hypothetical protein
MTDTNQLYLLLASKLNRSRKTLSDACYELNIDPETVDDYTLEQYAQECSHCGIWGNNHKRDEDNFPICRLCFGLVGR